VGARFIRSLDVQMNHIGDSDAVYITPPGNAEARRTKVQVGDVLLTITGSRIGRVAAVEDGLGEAYISQHVAILRLDSERLDPIFASFFLSLDAGGQRQISSAQYGQTKPGLNFDQIRRFRVPVPSIGEQREFTNLLLSINRIKRAQDDALARFGDLFASLQHRAFWGEL
jgi:type I restriction enzyme S subunit